MVDQIGMGVKELGQMAQDMNAVRRKDDFASLNGFYACLFPRKFQNKVLC